MRQLDTVFSEKLRTFVKARAEDGTTYRREAEREGEHNKDDEAPPGHLDCHRRVERLMVLGDSLSQPSRSRRLPMGHPLGATSSDGTSPLRHAFGAVPARRCAAWITLRHTAGRNCRRAVLRNQLRATSIWFDAYGIHTPAHFFRLPLLGGNDYCAMVPVGRCKCIFLVACAGGAHEAKYFSTRVVVQPVAPRRDGLRNCSGIKSGAHAALV